MESTLVKLSRVKRVGFWHFEYYSLVYSDAMEQIEKSQFPVHKLSSLLESATRGYAVTASDTEEGVILLTVRNVTPDGISLEDVKYISQEEHEKLLGTQVQDGDILIVLVGKPGLAALYNVKTEANINQYLALLRSKTEINPYYLVYYLNSKSVQALMRFKATGSVQPALTIAMLLDTPVVVPPLEKQNGIAQEVKQLYESTATSRQTAIDQQNNARIRFDELLSGE